MVVTEENNREATGDVYDVAVVGAGLFGCAAARHASAQGNLSVCLIGPDEPKTDEEYRQREIFSSHYDEGRIFQKGGRSPCGQELAVKSVARFKQLEDESGVKFCWPVGMILVDKKSEPAVMDAVKALTKENNLTDITSTGLLKSKFPFLNIDDEENFILIDESNGGYLSPRLMIQAQKTLCTRLGCHLVEDIVSEVVQLEDGAHKIVTEQSGVVRAKKVIVCAGGFTNFKSLVPRKLDMFVAREMAAMLRIAPSEAERLRTMPTIVYFCDIEDMPPTVEGCYILPPIIYPDGHHYLKIGHLGRMDYPSVETLQELNEWYNSEGSEKSKVNLVNHMIKTIPDLQVEEVKSKVCITSDSPSGIPYIDKLSPTLTVAAVGNSLGATFCEEVGRLAAVLSIDGKWDSPVDQSPFRAIYRE